jgi:hypothetical protein
VRYLVGCEINMFKISVVDTRTQRKLVVEGRLSEPWVAELFATWRNANRDLDGRKLLIDVSSVTVISREGEDAIFNMMKEGARFSSGSICTRYLLKRLALKCEGNLRGATQRTHIETEASSRR